MKNKKIGFLFIAMIAVLAAIAYAAFTPVFIEDTYPDNQTYWILGGAINDNITFRVNSSCTPDCNISNATLFHNVTGTWAGNTTNISRSNASGQGNHTFNPGALSLDVSDGMQFWWYARVCNNNSNGNDGNCTFTGNHTIFVESAPTIVLTPSNGSVTNRIVNITIKATNPTNPISIFYNCQLYTNESNGTWGSRGGTLNVMNSSNYSFTRTFPDGNITKWNVFCYESTNQNVGGWAPKNQTINIDTSSISIAVAYPNERYSNDNTTQFNFTPTSGQLSNCMLWLNATGPNATTTAMTSGSAYNIFNNSLPEGDHLVTFGCNTTAGVSTNLTPYTITVDKSIPGVSSWKNFTIDSCESVGLNITSNETLDSSTLYYGLHHAAWSSTSSDAHNGTSTDLSRIHNMTVYPYYSQNFTMNITMTDLAGNGNTEIVVVNKTAPVGVCKGYSGTNNTWSLYTIHNNINMTDLEAQILVSDYIYVYNETSQSFIFKTNGTGTNGAYMNRAGDVVWISAATNGTWVRNEAQNDYVKNLSHYTTAALDNNYVGITLARTMLNLSVGYFRNASGGNQSTNSSFMWHYEYFSAWNNSGKTWLSHTFNASFENTTLVGYSSNNSVDAIWTASAYNVTINSTLGYVNGTW